MIRVEVKVLGEWRLWRFAYRMDTAKGYASIVKVPVRIIVENN